MAEERNTKQKEVIYNALRALGHPSATELYEYVREANPHLSRGTVFRVLAGFAETGRARKLRFEQGDDRFDATLTPHFHARCRVCGKIFDVPACPLSKTCEGCVGSGFLIEECHVEYSGVCVSCRQ